MSATLLWRSSRRYLARHPWLLLLSVLGIALGVAVVTGIDLANTSARRAFRLSSEAVAGRATHFISGPAAGLDQAVYRKLRVDLGFRQSAPVVEGYVRLEGPAPRVLQLLGIDPFAEEPFRPYLSGETRPDLGAFMTRPRAAILSEETAADLDVNAGDWLPVSVGGRPDSVQVVHLLQPSDERTRRALENLLLTDISVAQEMLGFQGRLSRIDLILPAEESGDQARTRIGRILPAGAEIVRSSARTETMEQMTRAFDLNLTALSRLALVVGMFLIYNTMTFAVVQRRFLLGRLRALGVTRAEILRMVLMEALVVGLAGSLLGLLLGYLMGQGLLHLITRTINDLYYVVSVREVTPSLWTLGKGLLLGLGATLLAALIPAREAAASAVSAVLRRSETESRLRRLLPRLAVAGLGLGAAGAALLFLPTRSITLSYVAMLCLLLAFAALTGPAIVLFARLLRRPAGLAFGVLGRMAVRGVVSTMSRTAVATAALMVAVAAVIGVGVMVTSFRETVVVWLGYTLQADIYVQPPNLVMRRADATLDPGVVRALREAPGVESAYTVRSLEVRSSAGLTDLVVIDPGPARYKTFRFKSGDPDRIWKDFTARGGIIVSEPFSFHHRVRAGDTLTLQTDRGPQAFRIAGVYHDYGSDLGAVMMTRGTFEPFYTDRRASGLALYARPGLDPDTLIRSLRDRIPAGQEVLIRSNRALREASMAIFDRTFTITSVLQLLSVVVAFVGILSALMALQLERARELAILRANGLTPGQLWQYVTLQTGLMGLMAGLLAIPLGLTLALVLVYVINQRSFGWTLQFLVPPEILIQAGLVALAAALLAGLYPAWKMARANPALALREDGV